MVGPTREQLRSNLAAVQIQLAAALAAARRPASAVTLVVVTKYVSAETITQLYELGLRDFGERTVQDLVQKRSELSSPSDIRWHLVGHLQRNKVSQALQVASAVHSLDSLRLARELVEQSRRRQLPVPPLYVEVCLTGETAKTGILPQAIPELLFYAQKQQLPVRGLMTMGRASNNPNDSRSVFAQLRELKEHYTGEGLLPQDAGLSMGMSNDFSVAVEEGATIIRVGSRLFL